MADILKCVVMPLRNDCIRIADMVLTPVQSIYSLRERQGKSQCTSHTAIWAFKNPQMYEF